MPLSEEDVARVKSVHIRLTGENFWGYVEYCGKCRTRWPCDAYRLLVDREAKEKAFRQYLWLGHGCTYALYGDDGEMQCNDATRHGILDFKRGAVEDLIQAHLSELRKTAAGSRRRIEELEDLLSDARSELHCPAASEGELYEMREGQFQWGHRCGPCDDYVDRNMELRQRIDAALPKPKP